MMVIYKLVFGRRTQHVSGDIGLDTLKRQQVRSNESVFAPPEAKAVRLHLPAGSTLKGTLTRRKTSYVANIRQLKLIHLYVVLLIKPYDVQHMPRPYKDTMSTQDMVLNSIKFNTYRRDTKIVF